MTSRTVVINGDEASLCDYCHYKKTAPLCGGKDLRFVDKRSKVIRCYNFVPSMHVDHIQKYGIRVINSDMDQ